MALGLLWFARIPASTEPWIFELRHPSTWAPPSNYFVDLMPGFILFGIGLMIMVAPLTTALMTSVPKENSGVGSAVNNAISRVGPQLAGALIFVAITTSFYNHVGAKVGLPGSDPQLRKQVAPLNPAEPSASPELKRASEQASTEAFHLAMFIAAGLLALGAAVNAVGIRNPGGPRWMRQPRYADSATGQRLVGHAGHLGPPPEAAGKHT
jgi:hypothetical protein